ncbi:1,4-alpha-glucan branching protein GlgB [Paenibacillus sacheonensis]|uniref:1,4-alpha-glucan branching enzyme GlgB n=1 Tax=Paenibacillus sacheonensis TaxID=742054 RepID=A0A7X4YSR8_9BACL|nr:1,4-alpha-glucan branching protein GlgB [Paenibacillus sacheonensis]MBM7568106.1 1,4-alpha-glucan branching enzyme [Paenibacillus sacheonensis]NBC71892.1 1,4-alpha-glucan branching protein GlgB [Paenibacillus sacheonensis]
MKNVFAEDLYLFNTGQLFQAYRTFGSHPAVDNGRAGVRFAVWAPNARAVSVVGDFNDWMGGSHTLGRAGTTGVWIGFIPGMRTGDRYKYEVLDANGDRRLKADPFGFQSELRPNTASIVTRLDGYEWQDEAWMEDKRHHPPYARPMLTYETHLGTWRTDGPEMFRSYEQLADELVDYLVSMNYTHLELLPLTEHPFDQSWGYQTTGYYAATTRYGPPDGLKKLVDRCHQQGISVLLDWVPGHFCKDDHGLRLFDGTPLYEDADPRRAEKPIWGTLAFDFGKPEIHSFLLSNALFWMDVYHIDGIRVDAVASMIDLHFDKPEGMKTLNRCGTTEHLEALDFLRKLNETVFRAFPESIMIAEDSSAYPAVTSPTYLGGLGFNYKWNMGWMNDTLRYFETDPDQRSSIHSHLTFSLIYAFAENYVLPLSHDEVVHGKRSLLHKMPGSYPEKFANLRLFYGYWITHPGKKLLFMGGEFGQFDEWKDYDQLDWMLMDYPSHAAMQRYVRKLNRLYCEQSALWVRDHDAGGFEWIDVNNAKQCIISFIRKGWDGTPSVIIVCNLSRESYLSYRVGVPSRGRYRLLLNSDDAEFGGSGQPAFMTARSAARAMHGKPYSIEISIPALTVQIWTNA